ncbi:MAG: HAMP domain-containing histidine kinase [Tannerella sp.]|jgi:two-component system phosphate regulon sensor histidine kinase PhoR|nr:HAMP domain-containing histidine kinase [Tannerella sp.]
MSRHIKIIWILSLVAVLLLIGIQGYWLLNQYGYMLDNYSDEIASQVLQTGDEEFLGRKGNEQLQSRFQIKSNRDSSMYRFNVIIGTLGPESLPDDNTLFIQRGLQTDGQNGPVILPSDIQNQHIIETTFIDSTRHFADFLTNLSGDELRNAAERAVTNLSKPFDPAQFDSLLAAKLPDLHYDIVPWNENEVYDNTKRWERSGNVFAPQLTVYYSYSPLDNLGVYVKFRLPAVTVLYRMGIQLFVSIALTLLLIVALVLQVKVIIKQRKVNEIRESFVNTMVHELKRPVQTLKAFVSFLNDAGMRADTAATGQVVRDSMFELDNLTAYLNKLKDMLQADSETTSVHPVGFNLHDLVEKVIRLTHIPADKNVDISTAYEKEDLVLEADPIHIANVLSNLIENAIKYSGESVHIEIRVGTEKRKVFIAVKDDGIGIPAAEQPYVFTKFYRGHHLPDKDIPGIGLGLSYVKLIVEAHQGAVHLTGQPGEGTVVTIYLPQ